MSALHFCLPILPRRIALWQRGVDKAPTFPDVRYVPKADLGRCQPKLTSSGRSRHPHSRRMLDDRAALRFYYCPIVRADNCVGGMPSMQNPLIIGIIVFLILLAGAFASWTI